MLVDYGHSTQHAAARVLWITGLLPQPAASVFWAYHEVQGRDQVFHNCLTICHWIKRYDCKNICNFDSVRNKRGINVSCWTSWFDIISYGDGARCWENAFQALGSAKFFWGRTQTPTWASQLRCSQGGAPHDMVCPPSQKSWFCVFMVLYVWRTFIPVGLCCFYLYIGLSVCLLVVYLDE